MFGFSVTRRVARHLLLNIYVSMPGVTRDDQSSVEAEIHSDVTTGSQTSAQSQV